MKKVRLLHGGSGSASETPYFAVEKKELVSIRARFLSGDRNQPINAEKRRMPDGKLESTAMGCALSEGVVTKLNLGLG